MSWIYGDKIINSIEDIQNLELPFEVVGFIYEVEYKPTGQKYIGKKVLSFNRKLPPLKGKKRPRRVIKESDWKTYCGSNKILQEYINSGAGLTDFTREILQFCSSKKQLTFYETLWQFNKKVLQDSKYLNENILGKFYRKDLLD